MGIKNIFTKKKGHSDSGSDDGIRTSESRNSGSSSSNGNNSSNLHLPNLDASMDTNTTNKSFQYSYNSNTNSLFSSKMTMSTGFSSQPSLNPSYNKKNNNEQSKITSIGRPLRVLNEEDQEEDFIESGLNDNPIVKNVSNIKNSESNSADNESNNTTHNKDKVIKVFKQRRKSVLSDELSMCPTEKSNNSHNNQNSCVSSQGNNSNNSLLNSNIGNIDHNLTYSNPTDKELKILLNDFIKQQLRCLSNSITNTIIQISQSVLSLTKASITISENILSIYKIIKNNKYISLLSRNQFNTINSVGLRKIIKNILHLLDNLLIDNVYNKSKALVLKNLHDLFVLIKVIPKNSNELINFNTHMSPKIFPIDLNVQKFPNFDNIDLILNKLLLKEKENHKLFSDQDGSFIAPVLRGFQDISLSVITFIFGFPKISKEHQDVIKFFSVQSPDLHFYLQKNQIRLASTEIKNGNNNNNNSTNNNNNNKNYPRPTKLKSPYRKIDESQGYIPISMSLSTDSSTVTSGTLGGYLYPKVPNSCTNSKLLKYKGQIFGLTCAHVVLGGESEMEDQLHPNVYVPSPVLINLYKNALLNEIMNHSSNSPEYQIYSEAVKSIDEEFPLKKINVNGKKIMKNLPVNNLGTIIWGERLINNNKLCDLAIIKVNENLKKKFVNYLGEDLQLSQYDPSLILSNLNIKRTISLQPRKNGILNTANLNVFKVGSTTGYTNGKLNGLKMIYWSDGSLKSSEFIIQNNDNNFKMSGFANGGDSGAWVLSKLNDVNNLKSFKEYQDEIHDDNVDEEEDSNNIKNSLTSFIESFLPGINNDSSKKFKNKKKNNLNLNNVNSASKNEESGLGLLGMLHSYDGEFKQFGLFTPIDDILDRLHDVTGLEWGVVGCSEEDDFEDNIMGINSSDSSTNYEDHHTVTESDDD